MSFHDNVLFLLNDMHTYAVEGRFWRLDQDYTRFVNAYPETLRRLSVSQVGADD